MKSLKRYQYERYAVLCNLAYPRIFKQTNYGFDPNGQRIVYNRFGKVMMRVLWSRKSEEVIVVIKGSHSLWDWLLNLGMWQITPKTLCTNYPIHAGYSYLILQESRPGYNTDKLGVSVYERLLSYIVPLIELGKKVTFTGHSSGGAIGTVLADLVEKKYPKSIKRVVTFGQPAIGGYQFKKQYSLSHKTYRVCCDLDIVTFLPPLPFYYWHVGKLLWLHNERVYENTPTLIRLGKSIVSWAIRPFSYHLMSRYIRNKDFFDDR